VLRAPELDAGLQVGSHQSRAEGQNSLPRPDSLNAFCIFKLFSLLYPGLFLGEDDTLQTNLWTFANDPVTLISNGLWFPAWGRAREATSTLSAD